MIVDILLLLFIVAIAIFAISTKDILNSIILLGAYSLFMALIWTYLNAVDVAFTEASVGAGITSVLMLAALSRTKREEVESNKILGLSDRFSKIVPIIIVTATGLLLIYGTLDMPDFGSYNSAVHQHVGPYYIENSLSETGSYNMVTSVLASYRGYDTLGETTVVFTAGICLVLLLRTFRRKK